MSSRKRSSLRRRSRARSQTKLTRNGVMNIVIPVAVAGVGVAAYLLWKKARTHAAIRDYGDPALRARRPGPSASQLASATPGWWSRSW